MLYLQGLAGFADDTSLLAASSPHHLCAYQMVHMTHRSLLVICPLRRCWHLFRGVQSTASVFLLVVAGQVLACALQCGSPDGASV
jgi:hypothetical protein